MTRPARVALRVANRTNSPLLKHLGPSPFSDGLFAWEQHASGRGHERKATADQSFPSTTKIRTIISIKPRPPPP